MQESGVIGQECGQELRVIGQEKGVTVSGQQPKERSAKPCGRFTLHPFHFALFYSPICRYPSHYAFPPEGQFRIIHDVSCMALPVDSRHIEIDTHSNVSASLSRLCTARSGFPLGCVSA